MVRGLRCACLAADDQRARAMQPTPRRRRRLRSARLVLDRMRRVLAAEWQGPADMPRALMLEWRLIMARWVGIIFVAPALPLLNMPGDRLFGAYPILAGA